jgi:autotransporter-associated beta strand protein
MNHIYRIIWSKASNSFVAVSENAKSRGKAGSGQKSATVAVAAVVLALSGGTAFAGGVINGAATPIDGAGGIIDGGAAGGYFVQSGSLSISNATLSNFSTVGGAGSGGGAGLGGAVFVNSGASVTLNNVNFISNTVTGGEGGVGSFGGSLNSVFVDPITASLTGKGSNGYTPEQYTYVDVNGTTGTKGGNGRNMLNTPAIGGFAGSVGAMGGNGGSGGNGSGFSPPLLVAVISNIADAVALALDTTLTAVIPFTAGTVPAKVAELAVVLVATSDTLTSIDQFNRAVASGQVGLGGNGGAGGNGGNGSDFAGGGIGGNGGKGGTGASAGNRSALAQSLISTAEYITSGLILPLTEFLLNPHSGGAAGGDAGSGGNGGMGGFGAGGGAGGDGGIGGSGAGASSSKGIPAIPKKTQDIKVADSYKKGYYDPENPANFITLASGLADPITSYTDSTAVPGKTVTVQTLLVPGYTKTVETFPGMPEVKFSSSEARPNGLDGTGGAGGNGGFGGGAGASGSTQGGMITGGAGGSAMGGAIFVRKGGSLTITGNALFDNNQLMAGAGQGGVEGSIDDGVYGSTAGTDMLMMAGSNVLLAPGQGNTIQFNGSIDDDSAATDANTFNTSSSIIAGQGAGLTVASGRVIFNGSNSYSGQTKILGGALQADDGTGINSQSNINLAGGVLQSNGGMTTFSRYLGATGTGVQWTGSGGFAATGGDLTVSLNNNAKLTWGTNHFVGNGNALLFGSDTATDKVDFTNAIDLNGGNRTVLVTANAKSDTATLSGILSNGALTVGDATHTGVVMLAGANTYAGGTTINGGTLALTGTGSLLSSGLITANTAGTFDISKTGNQTIGNLDGSGKVMLGANTLTLSQNNDSLFSGSINDGGLLAGVGGGLVKNGLGALTLSGINTYTGSTQINSGTLNLTGSLASGAVNVAGGTTLNNTNAGLADNTKLTNEGVVSLGADDKVASLVNTGTINGTGKTLTAATYALNDGSVINANLGTGVMTNKGVVVLSGTSDAAIVNIDSGTTILGSAERLLNTAAVTATGYLWLGGNEQIGQLFGTGKVDLSLGGLTVDSGNFAGVLKSSNAKYGLTKISSGTLALSGENTYTGATQLNAGTLDLTGSLASGVVNVASGATLNDTNAGLADNTKLTNEGVVSLGADDKVASLVNTGTINGTGKTLTAATYALNDGSVINANLGTGVMTNNGAVALNGTSEAAIVNIDSGTTTLGLAERLLNTADVTVTGNLVLGGNEQIGQLFGAGNVDLSLGGLTVDSGNFAGVLQSSNASYGLTKIYTGTLIPLTLSGSNTYTGTTQINSGTVNLTGRLASGRVNIATGAQLNNVNSGLDDNAALTNEGVVHLGADDKVASLINTGTINGTGKTLTAATYALNDGSVINASLGTGFMTNNGAVRLNGTSDAATVNIASGTTTLGSAERLNNAAAVTTTGNLLLGGNEQIGTLYGTGNVDLSLGGLTVDSGNFAGVLGGGYGLTKISAGTLALSGNNTYTGSTWVNAGTLDLTGSLASGSVNVASGATLNDTNAGLAANAALTNAGSVNLGADDTVASLANTGTVNGTGKTLTADTYALNNGSVINANLGTGTMTTTGIVTLNGTSAADRINVFVGSVLNLGDAQNLGDTSSHLINSATTVTLDGTLNLYGGNEYVAALFGTGIVNLRANQLIIGNGGGAFAGSIKGANANLNVNGGSLALTNGTTTTQSTNISNGSTLTLTGGSINSSAITVGNNSVINLDANSTLNYALLNGGDINTPGGTIIAANFNNQLGSTVAGFLTFVGNFSNNGTLAPGNSPGLTTVTGDFTNNGIYLAEFQTATPISGYDQIRVGGAVTLTPSSTLIASPWAGAVPAYGNTYQIIANSVGGSIRASGAFGNVLFDNGTSAAPVSNAAVVFDVNTGKLITTGLNAANSTYADIGTNSNQRGAVSALMSVAQSGIGSNQIDSLTNSGKSAFALLTNNGSVERLVPEHYSSMTDYSLLANKTVSNILFSRPLSVDKSTGIESKNNKFIDHKNVYIGYTRNQYAVSNNNVYRNDFYLGAEAGSDKLSLGLLFLGSTGSLHSTYGSGSVDGLGGTAYLRAALTPEFRVLGSVGYTGYNYDLNRSSVVGAATASTTGDGINADLGLTYLAFDKNGYSIQPRLGIGYGFASVKGFQEAGSDQRLDVAGHDASRLSGQAGVIFAKDLDVNGHPLKVALDLGVESFFTDNKQDINAAMSTDTRVKFPIGIASNTKTFGSAGLSANYEITKSASIYAKYEANTMGDSISNNATVELKSSF